MQRHSFILGAMLALFSSVLLAGQPAPSNRVIPPGVNTETISGTKTLIATDAKFQRINGGTASRNVDLPALANSMALWYVITNTGTTDNLVVRTPAAVSLLTLGPSAFGLFACEGTAWTLSGSGTVTPGSSTFANTALKVLDTGGDHSTNLKQNSDEAADRTLNIPALGGNDTLVTLGTAQTLTGVKKFGNVGLLVFDTATDHTTTIKQNSDEAANRILNIPALGGDDTISTLGTTQTVTGVKTFPGSTIFLAGTGTDVLLPAGTINVNTTAVSTAANTAETDLITKSVAANTLSANGKMLRITAYGTCAATATTKRVRLYFGATAIVDTAAITLNSKSWMCVGYVIRTGAATQLATGEYRTNDSTSTTTAGLMLAQSTPAETLSGAVIVKITGLNGTANATDITCSALIVEAMN